MNIASYIDHTVLKPTATEDQIITLCKEAVIYGFAAVCVPPNYVRLAKIQLQDTAVKIATVSGFPFGYSSTRAKLEEIKEALADGADELDMVINLTAVKNGDWNFLENEIERCATTIHASGKVIKLIVESGLLTDAELISCCALARSHKIDFLKTSTGYAETGATIHAVQLMRQHLPSSIFIKASGGIRNYAFAKELIESGATRLGCSAGIKILEESKTV
ncbi:MAG TPA: deoxyribose-phosphate aldolase [Flavipsychrobacter sp.]|nr:deoxyribose-phosphate aldolase [Flavipsychrobacter sp.]